MPGRRGRYPVRAAARSPDGRHLLDLFSPIELGELHLANRVVMAPLTRVRSGANGVPGDLVAEYYAQRASVGLIISEGVYPGRESRGYFGQPAIPVLRVNETKGCNPVTISKWFQICSFY